MTLDPIGTNIWTVSGVDVQSYGFTFPTRMAVIRLSDQSLFILSPIALDDALKTEIDALGVVAHIVAPNHLHHLFLSEWQTAYPKAQLHAPPKLRQKRQDLSFDTELGDVPHPDWAADIHQCVFRGNQITTEVVFFHKPSGTVIFTDLIQRFPQDWFSGWRKIIAKMDLMSTTQPTVPRKYRLAFTDKKAAHKAYAHILSWPVDQLIMAHGPLVKKDSKSILKQAFKWLT